MENDIEVAPLGARACLPDQTPAQPLEFPPRRAIYPVVLCVPYGEAFDFFPHTQRLRAVHDEETLSDDHDRAQK
jgi:hypothetical protein